MYHSSFGSNANFSSVCDYWQPAHSHSGLRAEVYERRDEIYSTNYTRCCSMLIQAFPRRKFQYITLATAAKEEERNSGSPTQMIVSDLGLEFKNDLPFILKSKLKKTSVWKV